MSCCIYTRVSTTDQTVEPQLIELRRAANDRQLVVTHEITDTISGGTSTRPGLDRVKRLITEKQITVLLVAKLDRLARSLSGFCQMVDLMKSNGVALIIPGQGIDTSKSNPCAEMQLTILAAVAQFEKSLISERTKAGLVAARGRGKVLGRPSDKLPPEHQRKKIVQRWHDAGARGFAQLGEDLGGVSPATAWRVWKKHPPVTIMEVDL